ncbi:hypothetical protein GALMADRAFT_153615 [Galerina marginata CBS 339.88]|uniref:Uncharacterized protein n=1 Tax=Galerina marginata (strain CBS 339.88) TaxID=685588 RepID=A0A067TLP2_GALM3|nr:hypothetical protein GALMADRAFT_153615 [Galerina marginata CBS 339.88]
MTHPSDLNITPETAWKRLRDAALLGGTKPSTTFSTSPIEPLALLGSYSSVWDSHTALECMDDIGEEISWLHLTADSSLQHGTSVKDEKKPGIKTDETTGPIKPSAPDNFAEIQGEFKWWDMVGSFKGLYRPYGEEENIWHFGDVSWRPLEDDEGEVVNNTNTDDFGLATIVTLDKHGQPFLEMLYNATNSALEYVRVLWKKQKVAGRVSSLMISGNEGQRLMRDAAVDLSQCRDLEPLDKNNGVDADSGEDNSGDDEDDNEDDDANGAPEGEQNTLVGVKRELDGEDAKLAKKRKL